MLRLFNREPTDTELRAFKALAMSFDALPTSDAKSAQSTLTQSRMISNV